MTPALACRHAELTADPDVFFCRSPRLVGLKLVTPELCGKCWYRDHEPEPARGAPPPRLLPCAYWGETTAGPGCSHPAHAPACASACAACPDYLFPVVTPHTPAWQVQQLIERPPQRQPDGWWQWPNVQEAHRQAADEHLRRLGSYSGAKAGRGVVIVGGGRYFASSYVTLRVLRHVGCRLPVELWHLAGEVDDRMRRLVEPLGVVCIDADETARNRPFRFLEGHWWKGWQLKPYAVAHSRFREVLFLDADSYPTRNPEFLFDWDPYRQHGAIFWPDCSSSAFLLPEQTWRVFGVAVRQLPFESGQFVVDRQRCWSPLQLALWYNAHADYVYHHLWGDKDTFNIAWGRLGRDYAMPRPACGWEMHTILQYDADGQVLFQHRCQDKFRLGGEQFSGTPQPSGINRYNPRLVHEERCFEFLEELRQALR